MAEVRGGVVVSENGGSATTVQSVDRALDLLELLADAGGELGLTQLAELSALPVPTIHRLMQTLVTRGFVHRGQQRRYCLGARLIRLGEVANRLLTAAANPILTDLVDRIGETANLAVLEGDEVVYLAQAPSRHSMRMFTEVGRRVMPHCTGVGKALLAQLPDESARQLLLRTGMPRKTESTITDVHAMMIELSAIRSRGYAVDDGEQEVGVRCVAAAVLGGSAMLALSISGPQARVTREVEQAAVPLLHAAARRLVPQSIGI